jgi:thiamine-phosphate diphosphorylase
MVTARQRPTPDADRLLVERVGMAARAGVHLVQIRQPDYDGDALARLVESAVNAVRGTPARVLVNDRLDVALVAGAHGLHLRSDSVPAARVRAFAPAGFLIGRSVHSAEEARRVTDEGGHDYLIFGTVFATPSKPGQRGTGLAPLAAACADLPLPVLAIGGMTEDSVGAVAKSGAAGFAAINLFADCDPALLISIVARAGRAFDTSNDASLT